MEPCVIATLAGVFVGWSLHAGTRTRVLARALGEGKSAKLLRLLELLEEPEPEEENVRTD